LLVNSASHCFYGCLFLLGKGFWVLLLVSFSICCFSGVTALIWPIKLQQCRSRHSKEARRFWGRRLRHQIRSRGILDERVCGPPKSNKDNRSVFLFLQRNISSETINNWESSLFGVSARSSTPQFVQHSFGRLVSKPWLLHVKFVLCEFIEFTTNASLLVDS
jgi:hypothetical protein